jgi:hypothetical protein
LEKLGLRPLLVLHVYTYHHHSHHRGNVTAPYGCPNLKSWIHFGHNQEGGRKIPWMWFIQTTLFTVSEVYMLSMQKM